MKKKEPGRSEIRKDYVQDKYVIIAPHRAKRPHDLGVGDEALDRSRSGHRLGIGSAG